MSSYALHIIRVLVKIFDMHTLKQVYLYVICVDLYGLNQVQNLCIALEIPENPYF